MGLKKIMLVVPSLTAGGMERVMSVIANNFAARNEVELHLVLLLNDKVAFDLHKNVIVHVPNHGTSNPVLRFFKVLTFLRGHIKHIRPEVLLSFGSMYNSFVMIACIGLQKNMRVFLGDRSNPYRNTYFTLKKGGDERHDGILHFILKRIFYKRAHGILVQTRLSYKIESETLKHQNLIYFPNPIKAVEHKEAVKENIIINVGRFIPSKQQLSLVKMFNEINDKNWKLYFLGDGPEFEKVKLYVKDNNVDGVVFVGNVSNVDDYYRISKIFAFTTRTEGFPNSLGEAMTVPLACISYDCVAGPADLIKDNHNGFLIPQNDTEMFTEKLRLLMNDEALRHKFEQNSLEHMKNYNEKNVLDSLYKSLQA